MEEGSHWQVTPRQKIVGGAMLVAVLLVIAAYSAEWTGFRGQTLWDWLNLLIVPAVIAGVGLWFNQQQRVRELHSADIRAETDRQIAAQVRQDDILQSYLDQIGQLLLDENHPLRQAQAGDDVVTLARARTLTTLSQLDGVRKSVLMRFLLEAGLITGTLQVPQEERRYPTISLMEADLQEVDLSTYVWEGLDMTAADLSDADLSVCSLSDSWMPGARLNNAFLTASAVNATDLNGASLRGALLNGTELRGASLYGADLTSTDLEDADLTNADLTGEEHRTDEDVFLGADLKDANLTGANLTNAKVTQEQLDQAKSLQGATMPNGQKYEN